MADVRLTAQKLKELRESKDKDFEANRMRYAQDLERRKARMAALDQAIAQSGRVRRYLNAGTFFAVVASLTAMWSDLTAKTLVVIVVSILGARLVANTVINLVWQVPLMKKIDAEFPSQFPPPEDPDATHRP